MTNSINKSFILHKDSLAILDQLTDPQAGKLFKAISTYQNTGENTDLDQMTKIIITPFLNQFKRDDEKYQNSAIQGKLGNLKKYHLDIYQKVINKELTLEEGESLAYPDKQLSYRPPITPDQSGSLSVSVSASVSVSKKENKKVNEEFEKFWTLYNHKKSKALAVKSFKKALEADSLDNILYGLSQYVKFRGKESQFWKHPSTWLNQECWRDEHDSTQKQFKPTSASQELSVWEKLANE
tara:strand:- start:7195 stop:7911 length:717 start_codon:yes stop_codon:yes gene_type:complete